MISALEYCQQHKKQRILDEWDSEKNELLPSELSYGSETLVWWGCPEGHSYSTKMYERTRRNRECPYCSARALIPGTNDLVTMFPKEVKDWHPTKNGTLKPSDIAGKSREVVWWQCGKGHEWQSSVAQRTVAKRGCPVCNASKRKPKRKISLAEYRPDIVKEWHPTKNGNLSPADVCYGSNKRAWWICPNGHEYETAVQNRTLVNTGCPYCSNKAIRAGLNDLTTTRPDLAKQWHPTKNGDLLPTDVSYGSQKKVWWQCEKGHEWEATVLSRLSCGCPYCAGKQAVSGENDLATLHPDLIKEWLYEKNTGLDPTKLTQYSNKKAWWKCPKGHEYYSGIDHRTRQGQGCPYCTGRKVLAGFNDFETKRPDLVRFWDYEKNDLLPSQVLAGSNKTVFWKCEKGHEWEDKVCSRTRGGSECPHCRKLRLSNKKRVRELKYGDIVDEAEKRKSPKKAQDL